jgi:4-hydroxybutyrate dehydrogenase
MTLITFVTRVHFADRVLEDALAEEMARLGVQRPLVLVEAEAGDEVERLWDALPSTAAPVRFLAAPGGAADAALRAAAALFAESGCDSILGLGGARTLDLARILGGSGRRWWRCPPAPKAWGSVPRRGFRAPRGAAGLHALCHPLRRDADAGRRGGGDGGGGDGRARPLSRGLSQHRLQPAGRRHRARRAAAGGAEPRAGGRGRGRSDRPARASGGGARRRARGAEGLRRDRGGGARARGRGGRAARLLHAALLPEVLAFNGPAIADRFAAVRRCSGSAPADVAEALGRLAERVGLPSRLSRRGSRRGSCRRRRRARRPIRRTGPTRATRRRATTAGSWRPRCERRDRHKGFAERAIAGNVAKVDRGARRPDRTARIGGRR